MPLRNEKVQDKKFERTFKVSIKTPCRKWKGVTLFI